MSLELRMRSMSVKKPFIPAKYQQVEYLESTRGEYINTNLDFNMDYIYEFEYKLFPFTSIYSFFFGRRISPDGFGTNIEGGCIPSQNFSTIVIFNTGGYIKYAEDYENHHVILGKDTAIKDGIYYESRASSREFNSGKIFLFSINRGDENPDSVTANKVRFYNYKVSINKKVLQHLIPCFRKSDNKPGMYDIVNNVFYTNAGTGEFIVGPYVN